MSFSATEAAFEGFRVVRRKPLTVLFWALAYIVVMGAMFAVAGGTIASLMAEMKTVESSGSSSPEEVMTVWRGFLPLFALFMPASLLFGAVMNAAVVRSVLRPEQSGFGYLRLGMDELRVLVVTIVMGLLYFAFALTAVFLLGVLAGFVSQAGIPALWILVVLIGLAAVVLLVWLAARFSLAVPMTVDAGRIRIFESIAMTRKHAWPIVGMAIIAAIMSFVVGLLGGLVALPATMILQANGDLASMAGMSTLQIVQAAWPLVVGWIVIQSVLSALQLAVVYAPFSAAYRDLKAG